jgi:hypothetical protein
MSAHRVELKFDVIASCMLPDDGGSWKLENVSGKLIANGDDILTYRLVYSFPQGKSLGNASLFVKVWPELPEHGRRNGRPEAGFLVTPPSRTSVRKPGNFYVEPSHTVVVATSTEDAQEHVKAIYFSIEDCNYESTGPPLWKLSVNDSMLLARIPELKGRWTPLQPIHPDPALAVGVAIHLVPQHSPPWYAYRTQTEFHHIFGGKLSASRMFDFIAGRFFDGNKGGRGGSNNVMRFGRATESKMVLAYLLANNYVASEAGTYPHPRIKDSCGTPDALLTDTSRSVETLPEWLQKKWRNEPNDAWKTADWTRGNFEAKTMLELDYQRLGPTIKAEHICQMYWTMQCASLYWSEYIRGCYESKECRVWRVYLRPCISRKLEACVLRMQTDMIAGAPYAVVCDTQENRDLVNAFYLQAKTYNAVTVDANGITQRFSTLPWPTEQAIKLEKMSADYDVCRLDIQGVKEQGAEPAKKRQRKKAATTAKAPKMKRAAPAQTPIAVPPSPPPDAGPIRLTPASIMPMVEAQQHQTIAALVADLDETHKVLVTCLQNKDYDQALGARVFHSQMCRMLEIHGLCKALHAITEIQNESAAERDE